MRNIRHVVVIILLLASVMLLACGGGSTGTDGGISVRIVGTVKSGDGVPLAGIKVTVAETGETSKTDKSGSYSVPAEVSKSKITILISDGTRESQTKVENIHAQAGDTLRIDLSLNTADFSVSIVSVQIVTDETPTPTPVAVVSPGPTAIPRPTATPHPIKQSLIVNGALKSENGSRVPGFNVSIVGDSAKTVTDSNGKFSLRTRVRSITLLISNERNAARVTLPTFDENVREVSVNLLLVIKATAPLSGAAIQTLSEVDFGVHVSGTPRIRTK